MFSTRRSSDARTRLARTRSVITAWSANEGACANRSNVPSMHGIMKTSEPRFLQRRILENVLQGELHDPRIFCGGHLPEVTAVEIGDRVIHVERIGNVECFRSKLKLLRFTHLEGSGYSG